VSRPSRSLRRGKCDAAPEDQGPRERFHKAMTLQEAKSIARHLGLTLRLQRSGDYRVNFRDGNETTAYYTDNLEDAVNTAVEMARKRGLCLLASRLYVITGPG
jgi:hypothetical protein